MDLLEKYIIDHKKTHLIFDFDKTLFKLIIGWDKYFEEIEKELILINKQLYLDYNNDLISWSEMQNLYIRDGGERILKLICLNNIQSENKYFKKALINKPIWDFIRNTDNISMYILSSNTKDLIQKLLYQNKILDKFENIICRDNLCYLKPDSEGFSKIYDPKIPIDSYVLIGDSENDANAAINSKIDFFKIDFFKS